jgi:dTDP-4-amino-4,6-dideoxygalactose transaminase
MEQLDEIVTHRNKVASMYKELENFAGYFQQIPSYITKMNWFLVQWIVPNEIQRNKILEQLERHKIPYRIPWMPIHKQPIYNIHAKCPNAEWIYEHVISLPIGNAMPEEHVRYVVDTIKEVFR